MYGAVPAEGVAVNVVELPLQMVALPLVLTVGLAFTVTAAVAAALVQLLASVTVTE